MFFKRIRYDMSMVDRDPDKTNPPESRPGILWDDSRLRTVQPKVWELTADREEITLLFGTIKGYQAGRGEWEIAPGARIVLSPFVAKRLAMALDMEIRRYESKYGPLEQGTPPPAKNSGPAAPPERPSPCMVQKGDDKAQWIFRLTRDLNVELGFERSFKLSERRLLGNRFLLGISKRAIEHNPHRRILDICARMNMPEELLGPFERYLPDADYIHFGFEENEGSCIYKAYLEFHEKIKTEVKNTRPRASRTFLMHMGFKWDVADPARRVVTNYTWYPFLSVDAMEEKLSGILDPHGQGTSLEIARGILGIASRRVPRQDILYLEVIEEGNPRKSFDINIYRANLKLGELYPFLLDMCRHYSIPPDRFHALYEQVKGKVFGHLAGGIDREGRDFLTLYYGVEGIRDHDAESGPPGDETVLQAGAGRAASPRKMSSFNGIEE